MIILDEEKFEPLLRSFQIEMSAQTTLLGQILAVNMDMFSSYQERIQDIARTEELQKAAEPLSHPVVQPEPRPTVAQPDNTNTIKDGAGLGLLNASALKDILFGDKSLFGAGIGGFLGKSVKSLGGAFLLGFGLLTGKEFIEGMFEVDIDKMVSDASAGIVELNWKDAVALGLGKMIGGPLGAVSMLVSQNLVDAFSDLSGVNLSPAAESALTAMLGFGMTKGGSNLIRGVTSSGLIRQTMLRLLNPYTAIALAVGAATLYAMDKLSDIRDSSEIEEADLAIKNDSEKMKRSAITTLETSLDPIGGRVIEPETKKIMEEKLAVLRNQLGENTDKKIEDIKNNPDGYSKKDKMVTHKSVIEKLNTELRKSKTVEEKELALNEYVKDSIELGVNNPGQALALGMRNFDPQERNFVEKYIYGVDIGHNLGVTNNRLLNDLSQDGIFIGPQMKKPGFWSEGGFMDRGLGGLGFTNIISPNDPLIQDSAPTRSAQSVEAAIVSGPQISVSNSHNTIVTNATTSSMSTRGGGSNGPIVMGISKSPDKSIMMYNIGR